MTISSKDEGFPTHVATLFDEAARWVSGNFVDILIAAGIGTAIALLLLGVRAFSCRLMRKGPDTAHWRSIFAGAIAKTGIFFIVMVSIALVAEHANTPPALLRAVHFLFVIAAAFQAAIWARE